MALPLALMIGGGLLSAAGSIADRLRERRESRRAIKDLEPYTDPLQGFAQSRGILEAMNQMGTGNLAQLATRMGGSVGAAQAAGAGMGAQSLSNAYLGALETGRQRAFQAQAMQNQLRDTKSLLGGAMRDIGGVALDVGMRMFNPAGRQPQTSQELMSTAAPTDYIPEADELDLRTISAIPSVDELDLSYLPTSVATLTGTPNIPDLEQALPSFNISELAGGGVTEGGYDAARRLTLAQRGANLFDTLTQGMRNRMSLRRGSLMQMPQQQIPSMGGFNPMAEFNPNRVGSISVGPLSVYGGPMDLASRRTSPSYSLDSLINSGAFGNIFNPSVR